MTNFQKLIIKEWFHFFLISFLILLAIFSIGNIVSLMLKNTYSAKEILISYLILIPTNLKIFVPISCLAASMLSISKLKKTNELVAIFSSGYRYRDFFLNITVASSVIAFFLMLNNFFLTSFANSKKDLLINDGGNSISALKRNSFAMNTLKTGKIWHKGNSFFFSFSKFDKIKKNIQLIDIYYLKKNRLESYISGEKATFDEGKKVWIVDKAKKLSGLISNLPKMEIVKKLEVNIGKTPNDFEQILLDINILNFFELFSYVYALSKAGLNVDEYKLILYENVATVVLCIVFAMISSLLVYSLNTRTNSGGKMTLLISIFFLLYWLIKSYLNVLSINGNISPFLASFGAVIFCIFIFIYGLYKNRKLI